MIGEYLRWYRKQRQLTLKDVSGQTGYSISFLSELERNAVNPSIKTLWDLCLFYEIAPSEVLNQYENDHWSETCQSCHERVGVVWRCSDELWQRVTGNQNGEGIRCIRCFDKEAKSKNIYLQWNCCESE